ncbi:MAG: Flp family type IVb pilin [Actinomycetota bacterium]
MTTALYVRLQNAVSEMKEERGAAMAEYGLLLALVALAAIGILVFFGGEVISIFEDAGNDLDARGGAPAPAAP